LTFIPKSGIILKLSLKKELKTPREPDMILEN
jgi:hypothetical protein